MDEKLLESPSHTDDPAPKGRRWKWSGIKGKKKWIALVLAVAERTTPSEITRPTGAPVANT